MFSFVFIFVSGSVFEKELRMKVVCKLPARLPGILADYSRRREVAFSFSVSGSVFEKELRVKVGCTLPARLPGILADYSRRREVAFSLFVRICHVFSVLIRSSSFLIIS